MCWKRLVTLLIGSTLRTEFGLSFQVRCIVYLLGVQVCGNCKQGTIISTAAEFLRASSHAVVVWYRLHAKGVQKINHLGWCSISASYWMQSPRALREYYSFSSFVYKHMFFVRYLVICRRGPQT